MKPQPMTPWRWVEFIFGAILPTILLGPWLLIGLLSTHSGFLDWFFIVGPTVVVVSMWVLLLLGPGKVNEKPWLRWFIIGSGILGIGVGGFICFQFIRELLPFPDHAENKSFVQMLRFVLFENGRIFLWIPAAAMAVGLKYLPKLIRGNK